MPRRRGLALKDDNLSIFRCPPQGGRIGKSGENPARSRHCKGRARFEDHCKLFMGRGSAAMTPESEDLPANVDGRIFLRTMGRCDGKGLKYSVVSIYAVPGNGVFFMRKGVCGHRSGHGSPERWNGWKKNSIKISWKYWFCPGVQRIALPMRWDWMKQSR